MTAIIGLGCGRWYSCIMTLRTDGLSGFDEMARLHEELVERIHSVDAENVETLVALGTAVVFHGWLENSPLFPHGELIDPFVTSECASDHREIAALLRALEDLSVGSEPAEDRAVLATALRERLCSHVDRDARLLYGPLARRWAAARSAEPRSV